MFLTRFHARFRLFRGVLGGLGLGWAFALVTARFGWVSWEPGPFPAVARGFTVRGLVVWGIALLAGGAFAWIRRNRPGSSGAGCGWLLISAVVLLPAACSRAQWPFLFGVIWPVLFLGGAVVRFGGPDLSPLRGRVAGSAAFVVAAAALLQTTAYVRFLEARGPHTGDEGHYLIQARSLAEDGDTDISNQLGISPDEPPDSRNRLHHHISPRSARGRLYSHHPAGLPILLAPFWRLGGNAWAGLLVVLAAALTAWNLHAAAREAGCSPAASRDLWLACGLSSPFVVFGARVYPEIFGALWALYAARVIACPQRRRLLRWWVAAVAVGTLPWLHSPRFWPAAVVLAAWGAISAVRRGGISAAAAWCALVTGLWAWLGWWNGLRFSAGLSSALTAAVAGGYGGRSVGAFLPLGPIDAFLGSRKGLALIAPGLAALIAAGLWGAWRNRRESAAIVPALAFLAGAGPMLFTWYWFGGHASHPGRVFIVGLPLLVMPAARLFRDAPRPLANPAFRMAVGVSALATIWILARPGFFDAPMAALRRSDPAAAGFLALFPSFEAGGNPFVDRPVALAAVLGATAWWIARGAVWGRRARRNEAVGACDVLLPLGVAILLALPAVALPRAVRESPLAWESAARVDPPSRGLWFLAAPPEGRPAPASVILPADRLIGTIGAVTADGAGGSVREASVPAGGEGGWPVTGPVRELPPGRYRVRFELADRSPDAEARWDVRTGGGGGEALVSRPIAEPAGASLHGEFVLRAPERIAVRVRLWSGRIAMGPLEFQRVPDEETAGAFEPGRTVMRWVGRRARARDPARSEHD